MRRIYWFYYNGNPIASEIATSENEAFEKAIKNSDIFCNRPYEAPFEYKHKIRCSTIRFFNDSYALKG